MTCLIESRKPILFPAKGADFIPNCEALYEKLKAEGATAAEVAAGIALDLGSYLREWKLAGFIAEGSLNQTGIDAQIEKFLSLAKELGGEKLYNETVEEAGKITKSSIKKMCELRIEGKLNTVWGHDYATNLTHSLRRGARWVTSNPCKITAFKKDCPEIYAKLLKDIKNENPGASVTDMTSLIFTKINSISMRELRPIFEASHGEWGFVCTQTDPRNIEPADSTKKMIEQIRFWDESYKKELGVDITNAVYKLPAVENGLEAARVLAAEGYKLCMTLNFTVTQHEKFAEIFAAQKRFGFVVLMGGLLDDKVGVDLESLGIPNAKEIGRHAAQAVIRKSYRNLRAKGYDKYVSIMTAAVRGPWAIANSLAPADGAPISITTLTNKINEFDENPSPLCSDIDTPVDPEIMNILMQSKVFRQAYALPEDGLLSWNDLYSFPPFIAFYDQFRDAYTELENDIKAL
ncbi:MAG: transaldolase family protein [Oscillospiraceae bacterium]